jgi:adenylate kinase family enzyme
MLCPVKSDCNSIPCGISSERIQRALHLQVGVLFDLQASAEVVKDRLLKRARLDDDEDGIAARLAVFERERKGVLKVAEKESIKVISVDGEGTIDEIRDQILKHLKDYINV